MHNMTEKTWRDEIAELNQFSSDNYSKSSLDFVYSTRALKKGIKLIDYQYYGSLKEKSIKSSTISAFIEEFGFEVFSSFFEERKLEDNKKNQVFYGNRFSACYVSEKGYIKIERRPELEFDKEDYLYFDITIEKAFLAETDIIEKFVDQFCSRFEAPTTDEDKTPIYTLVAEQCGYSFMELDSGGRKFIPENYPGKIKEQFDKLVENIQSENPFGRLTVLTGLPGTGKTYFIKGLIEKIKNVKFVMVDPGIMANISQPQLVKVFLQESNKDRAIVLCIEDADSCLVERMSDNIGYISGLLNLTDGIVGEAMNIHVIASTNQSNIELDRALCRPGRLQDLIQFNKLSQEEAELIYKRESGKDAEFIASDSSSKIINNKIKSQPGFEQQKKTSMKDEFTIAEIYNRLYTDGLRKKLLKEFVTIPELKLENLIF